MKSAIFDLDGVIVDTAKFHFLAWKKISQKYGYELDETQNEKLKGISRSDSLINILKWSNKQISKIEFTKTLEEKNIIYLNLIKNLTKEDTLPGVFKILSFLKKKGIKIALGSASKNSIIVLNKLSLTKYFDVIIDGNDVVNSKPDPEVFIKGAKELGVSCEECIVFEDSEAGVKAARFAKMNVVGICNSKKELKNTLFNIEGFLSIKSNKILKHFL
ncbi:MAG: beta-phosphoglucomutase [Flavobacteriaceae bacterium]|nr:beta-phosphoglucomutase [Flavobacteriaceae bacterium]